ncbi:2-deoxyglucose-6-phosphatase [Lysobacter helvus]|uniref:2-deoxyglucose-6-phosphatase n=2 Tax=Lysobacteraceae TaxID=32033 RepID=A0ABN6FXV6_9GAMM|nr:MULTISPECIES: hexitol phosphatase HxpB [Lysobacter]BCT92473.1 2-deoxyglucose-6-phosphatase [Lysobacter caseinilyticus]BCT95626.1 2-deoxyglucose-6-phosphatase [Lysobacter helvus]
MLRAAIFDLDGLLIDSEAIWFETECEVFGSVGIKLTPEMGASTQGFRLDEVVAHWWQYQPWEGPTRDEIAQRLGTLVAERVASRAKALPGAVDAVRFARSRVEGLAIASATSDAIIHAALQRLGIAALFDVVHSAESEARGKPDPAVFLSAARMLGIVPGDCVVFEDSVNGVIAAKAAGMRCIAVPEAAQAADPRYAIADMRLRTLEALDARAWDAVTGA